VRRRDPRYIRSLQVTLTDMAAFITNSSWFSWCREKWTHIKTVQLI
jgi:hypothetical protein